MIIIVQQYRFHECGLIMLVRSRGVGAQDYEMLNQRTYCSLNLCYDGAIILYSMFPQSALYINVVAKLLLTVCSLLAECSKD